MPPTEQQLKNRLVATQNLEQGLPKNVGFDNTVITSDTLQGSESPIDITPFETPSIPEIEGLPTISEQFQATLAPVQEAQKEKSELEKRIEKSEGILATKPTRTAELEKERGIEAKRVQVTDLENQLRTIIAQQKAIPLQLQEEARGRGITVGGLRPLETARLRTNAIRALGVSATLQAAQNNMATALDLIDRSIELEFGQQEAELARRREQLSFVREDLSAAEKKRAVALDRALDREEQEIEEQKRVRTQVQNMAIQAAQAGADAQTIRAIQNARTIEDATLIANESGAFAVADDLQFISGTKTQPGGVFNRTTGVFTPTGGVAMDAGETNLENSIIQLQTDQSSTSIKNYIASVANSTKLGEGTKTQLGAVINVAGALEDFANANIEGVFSGLGAGTGIKRIAIGVITGGISEAVRLLSSEETKAERTENRQAIEAINLKMQIWASGAALTDAQTKQVERLAPKAGNTDREIKRKINGLYNFMMQQTESRLLVEGFNNPIPQVNLFEFEDLLSQASPAQLEELESLTQ